MAASTEEPIGADTVRRRRARITLRDTKPRSERDSGRSPGSRPELPLPGHRPPVVAHGAPGGPSSRLPLRGQRRPCLGSIAGRTGFPFHPPAQSTRRTPDSRNGTIQENVPGIVNRRDAQYLDGPHLSPVLHRVTLASVAPRTSMRRCTPGRFCHCWSSRFDKHGRGVHAGFAVLRGGSTFCRHRILDRSVACATM